VDEGAGKIPGVLVVGVPGEDAIDGDAQKNKQGDGRECVPSSQKRRGCRKAIIQARAFPKEEYLVGQQAWRQEPEDEGRRDAANDARVGQEGSVNGSRCDGYQPA
jgi:hypothetical protein